VRGGKLSVPIEGDTPPGWGDTFGKTIRLLDAGDWEEINVKKRGVRVKGVSPGTEERLRHLLESALQQANSNHMAAEEESDGDREREQDASDDASSADAEMTERFRSFASQV
jgi:hypothetical protein